MSLYAQGVGGSLLNPLTLSFCLGAFARLTRSDLSVPKEISAGLSLFLLFAIGLKGGHELSNYNLSTLLLPATVSIFLGFTIPVVAYWILRKLARLSVVDSAGIAAHYGSVSAVTFIAAQTFVTETLASKPAASPLEGYLPTLVALMESPGIQVALALGLLLDDKQRSQSRAAVIHELLTGRTMMLLVGGLAIGAVMGTAHWIAIAPLFDPTGGIFKGLLCIFLLEMGLSAASRLAEVRSVGPSLLVFGIMMPIVSASLAIPCGYWAGLSCGGTAVLASISASASYIAAPPAVRATLPEANPAYYLTLALAITFPFNIVVGIPLFFSLSEQFYNLFS